MITYNILRLPKTATVLYSLYKKKMVQSGKNYLDMIFVENVYVFGIILKWNNCSFCCFSNHIIYFCKARVMLRLVRQGKIPFVALLVFIAEIVMKVSTTKHLFVRTMMKEITEASFIMIFIM